MKNKILSLLTILLMSSCQGNISTNDISSDVNENSSVYEESESSSIYVEPPQVSEDVAFYQDVKVNDLSSMKQLILDNINDVSLKENITNMFGECEHSIKYSTSISSITQIYDKCISDIYNLIPTADNDSEVISLNDAEKENIMLLLDEYVFRNSLMGAPLANSDWGYESITLNTLNNKTWEYFFGENGTICQTTKENYWDVKPFMSNDNFIKGINLALDKSLFLDITPNGSSENINKIIDVTKYDYYKFDIDLARKYFKVALEEMVEQGIYDVSNLSEPINLTIEIAWDPWSSYKILEEVHNNVKACLESAFNVESVTNGNFTLTVDAWHSDNYGQIFSKKIYKGQYDASFGQISGTSIDNKTYRCYRLLSSNSYISKGFNVNWSLDTSSYDDCIVYNGYKYSYDSLLNLLIEN